MRVGEGHVRGAWADDTAATRGGGVLAVHEEEKVREANTIVAIGIEAMQKVP